MQQLCVFQFHETFTLQLTLKQYGYFELVQFSKKLGRLSSAGPEILAPDSHCSANFQLIFDCFVSNVKLKYENSENIKTDRADTTIFNLHKIKQKNYLSK